MKFRQQITLNLLLTFVFGSVASAQPVHMPDANLRAAIEEAQGHGGVTQQSLLALDGLDAKGGTIADLSGLEFAANLEWLFIANNQVTNLAPLSGMKRLETLHIYTNPISDISPLAHLSNLKYLNASGCEITDITPLASLTELIHLHLSWNDITDITPLANLNRLKRLKLRNNPIVDYRILDGLSLDYFEYDQSCDLPPLPLQSRLDNRTFPSVFSSWGSVLNQPHLSEMEQFAQHDLYFTGDIFYQHFLDTGKGWDLRSPLSASIQVRDDYLALNPNMIFIIEISMRDLDKTRFPTNSPYWVKDANGQPVAGTWGTYLLNFTHPGVQDMIVGQVLAVDRCGLYDGVFLDWWSERTAVLADGSNLFAGGYVGFDAEQRARNNILQRIRSQVRPNFLILANTNWATIPRTGSHINGSFMETGTPYNAHKRGGHKQVEQRLLETEATLRWLEQNLKTPHINSLEGSAFPNEPPDSPRNRRWMRAFTALSLTHSDGYILFKAEESWHGHYWYDFWDADLGRPVGEKGQLYEDIDGLYIREFTNGWAVYNHSGDSRVITLPEETKGVASGLEAFSHTLANLDGEMYLRVTPVNPADVNGDGVVNILDLTLVAQALGTDAARSDVNGDGLVNVVDLVLVAEAF